MSLARAISRGAFLNARFGVNGTQNAARSFGTDATGRVASDISDSPKAFSGEVDTGSTQKTRPTLIGVLARACVGQRYIRAPRAAECRALRAPAPARPVPPYRRARTNCRRPGSWKTPRTPAGTMAWPVVPGLRL